MKLFAPEGTIRRVFIPFPNRKDWRFDGFLVFFRDFRAPYFFLNTGAVVTPPVLPKEFNDD